MKILLTLILLAFTVSSFPTTVEANGTKTIVPVVIHQKHPRHRRHRHYRHIHRHHHHHKKRVIIKH